MKKFFCPSLGTRLKLADNWKFRLCNDTRNESLFKLLFPELVEYSDKTGESFLFTMAGQDRGPVYEKIFNVDWIDPTAMIPCYANGQYIGCGYNSCYKFVELPTDTVLSVDRIYIRKNAEDFDSLTFKIEESPLPLPTNQKIYFGKKQKVRFWAKLDDVNLMDADVL